MEKHSISSLSRMQEVRTADAERVKNFRRAVTTSVQEAKPPRYTITEEQWGTLKNLKRDKSMVGRMADSCIVYKGLAKKYHKLSSTTCACVKSHEVVKCCCWPDCNLHTINAVDAYV
ncbi:hypothetical protein P5673_012076 [Acropora cervicornis]|uniref:Uncharacterized protein n=1 Tax=Acropora cervicornis TaxID=6130 RepID=A0AAD9QNQ6_ACRCE|nr:hypothetical protein P5673_012076 [Acropora cervicornis]